MRVLIIFLLMLLLAGCSKVNEAELKTKSDACLSAGMNYSYLNDFTGKPYDVMCVAKRK